MKVGLQVFVLSLLFLYIFTNLWIVMLGCFFGFHCNRKQNSIHNQVSLLEGLLIILNWTTEDFWKSIDYRCFCSLAKSVLNQFLLGLYHIVTISLGLVIPWLKLNVFMCYNWLITQIIIKYKHICFCRFVGEIR